MEYGDLISRQAAIAWCRPEDWGTPDERWRPESEYGAMIEALPPAQPERKKGKWEVCDILDYAQRPTGRKILRCPSCGYLTGEFRSRVDYYRMLTHFCPNCGNEMGKGETYDEN